MEQAPLVYALVHALDRAITGEMVFRTPDGDAHTVTFFEGAPVRVESAGVGVVMGERIGEDLVAMDYLHEAALAEALKTAETSRRRLGELLVQAEAVDPDVLTEALTLQTARRLAGLANLPPTSTFSLYFSARAEPEPFAPWAPLDTLLATVRAWTDRSRMHGTLRWLARRPLALSPESNVDELMLTSRERSAVAMMQSDAPSLKHLYATVGKGLSSLLYTLAVTRHFSSTEEKGPPMGLRKSSDLVGDLVQVAVPIAPVIAPAENSGELSPLDDHGSVPPPPNALPDPISDVPPPHTGAVSAPVAAPARSLTPQPRRKVSIPPQPDDVQPAPPRAAIAPPPSAAAAPAMPPPPAPPNVAPSAPPAPPIPSAPPAARVPPRPSHSPPKFVDQGQPPGRIVPSGPPPKMELSPELRRAEEAIKREDFETADRILKERCTEQETASPEYQAMAAWIRAQDPAEAGSALNDLTFLLMSHSACQPALYYRGLLLKRAGKDKAALRDFVGLVKENPSHAAALVEIKLLRDVMKR
jgi:hypothetical protein